MGRWSRDELEEAFDAYQKTALAAGTSCNWREWADMFTEDATYVEHSYGEFGGREAIGGAPAPRAGRAAEARGHGSRPRRAAKARGQGSRPRLAAKARGQGWAY